MSLSNVVIVMAKCEHQASNSFGIRFEEKSLAQWVANWAFPIKETAAKREGYDESKISGNFILNSEYPGCPFCKNPHIVRCGGCGKVNCWKGQGDFFCSWCGNKGKVEGTIDELKAGGDR